MHASLLHVHGFLRWLILLAGFAAVTTAFSGWNGLRLWTRKTRIPGLAFVGLLDLQLLLGAWLYAISPLVRTGWADLGAAMKVKEIRFFTVEHAFGMLLALILAHVGSVLVKRAASDTLKYRRAALFYGLSLALILGSIPWWRPLA